MQRFFLFFLSLFFILPNEAVDLTCPNSPVTSKTSTGKFPSAGLSVFPSNYSCGIEFNIPNGQVLKFIVQTNAISAYGDQIAIRDSVSTLYEMGIGESQFYAAADNAYLWITTKTNTSSFFFTWQYIDVTGFTKIQNPTGSIIPLNLTQNSYYQFTSTKSRVAFHTASVDRTYDLSLIQVYVYDGEDLNSKFLGTLRQFRASTNMSASTGKSLTLVNFYGTPTKSYGIANDYSAVFGYFSYTFFILSKGIDYTGNRLVPDGFESAVTFYCIDSQETYINELNMEDRKNGAQATHFKPLTPTDVFTNLLNYNIGDPISQSLPQQILTNTFTMVMYQCNLYLSLSSGPSYIWTLGAPGRRGSIISPSVWNPRTSVVAPYSTNITTQDKVKFVFNLQSIVVDKPGDKIRIEIGSSDSKPIFVEFNTTDQNTGEQGAYGTYMSTTFTGTTAGARFIMNFKVEGNSTSTTSTTALPVVTTTKSSVTLLNLSVLTILISKLLL
ncbi:hypothetical protein CRE_05403 [Caenorhabditis remanei]|uniref:CUB-like domain-containing protein n=1 Tax=Caenorhabditis remanei TaxID=31234 RepID=E3M0D8_CAERE|nr:hypothetical protein CRE_05403 [Caenorhabditis remanei]